MSSALPKAVQQQIATANAIIDKVYPKEPPPEEPKAEELSVDEKAKDSKAEDTQPEPKEVVTDDNAPPPTPPASDDEKPWEHKYNVLRGKYNAEVPRLQRQLQDQEDMNRELRQRINNMETTVASIKATSTAPAKEPAKPLVSAEEIETFGPDLHDFIQRTATEIAKEMVSKGTQPLADKVTKVEQNTSQVSQTMAQSKQQELLRVLGEQVPNWTKQNEDPEFLNWLDQTDPYAGSKRGDLLRQAFQGNDTNRVVAFFKGYLNENAAVTTEQSSDTPTEEKTTSKEPQTKIENLVAPGAANAPTASAPNEAGKRTWTQKDVAQLYAQKNEYVKKGKKVPEELDKLERDLFKAQKEGRIKSP